MRKIKTAEIKKKEESRKRYIIGVIFAIILIGSTLGYSLMSGDFTNDNSKVQESGQTFYKQEGLWKTELDGIVYGFRYLPSEVSNVSVNTSRELSSFVGQTLYYTEAGYGEVEIINNLGGLILRYQKACLENDSCEEDLPSKDCNNNIIITASGNETEVYSNENCVYLVGDSVRAADAFLYKVLKI